MLKKLYSDERGFLLIMTMIMLVVLTLIGITALDNSVFEIRIAGNDRSAKTAFNMADGAVFATSKLLDEAREGSGDPVHGIVEYQNFNWLNKTTGVVEAVNNNANAFYQRAGGYVETKTDAGLAVTPDYQMQPLGPGQPQTIDVFLISRNASFGAGSGVESHAGASGGGVSGGTFITFDVDVDANAANNSRSSVSARFRKRIGE